MAATVAFFLSIFLFSRTACSISNSACAPNYPPNRRFVDPKDRDLLQFALNLEYLEAEFFLYGAFGYGLDKVAPELALGGPPPVGTRKANLYSLPQNIIAEFGFQEVGHLRAIQNTVGGFPRPLLNLSSGIAAAIVDGAFGYPLNPPFDPYVDSINYMLTSYLIPYLGLGGYVGANPMLKGDTTKALLAGLLGVESGQDAVIRTYLYGRRYELVYPYNFTVAEFTTKVSSLRNTQGNCGIKEEGIIVPLELGAERKTTSNVLSADARSVSYARSPAEILRIVYGTGSERIPGGVYPNGASGNIARSLLKRP